MRRSEYLRLLDMAVDFRARTGGTYAYDEAEGRYEDGKESAYDSSADSIDDFLADVTVDVEDVATCPSTTVYPFAGQSRMHEAGSNPFRMILGSEFGCRECSAHVAEVTRRMGLAFEHPVTQRITMRLRPTLESPEVQVES